MSIEYSVSIGHYARRHFISKFAKKFKGAWDVTWDALVAEFGRFDTLLETSIAEVIACRQGVRIAKTQFRVAGTKESRKGSGNRCIIAVHEDTKQVVVLLVYHKNDISGKNETATWKGIVRMQYGMYAKML